MTLIWSGDGSSDATLVGVTEIRGVEATNTDGALITQVTVNLKKSSSISGSVHCRIYTNASSITYAETSTTVLDNDSPELTTSYNQIDFTFSGTTAVSDGYRVGVQIDSDETGTVYMQKGLTNGTPDGYFSAIHYDSGSWGGLNANQNYNMKLYTGSPSPSGSGTLLPPPIAMVRL